MSNKQQTNTLLKRGDFIGRLSREVELREFILKQIADRADEEVPRHTHNDAHFIYIIHGLYSTSASGLDQICSSSTLIFNPAGTTHRDHFHTRGGRFFTVSLKPDSLSWLEKSTDLIERSIGFSDGEVTRLGSKLYTEFQKMDEVAPIVMEGLLLELLGHTIRTQVRQDKSPPRWLQLAHQFIHDRFTESLTVREIAQTVGAHPVYLVSAFRKHYRLTVGEYLRKLRVEFACRQISLTDTPLSQIAAAAGFYDQSHFTRTFKSLTGMTPTEYRAISRP